MTIAKAISNSTEKLKKVGINSARLDAEILLSFALNKQREYLIINDNEQLSTKVLEKYNDFIYRRAKREPLCYITNKIEFYGIEFYVDHNVLSPRVETETIVEQVVKQAKKNSTLLDIGTGSGAIAIAIAKNRPDIKITASEISMEALKVAQKNAKKILSNNTIEFIQSDLFVNIKSKFDIIVTNLPYVSTDNINAMKPEVKNEPSIALYGGSGDGLALYKKFYNSVKSHTSNGTMIYHESDPWQHQALKTLANSKGFTSIFEDYFILGFQR